MALTLHGTVADNTVVLDRRSAKPLIINGDMQVAQRATSVTGLGDGDEGYVTVDRFRHSVGAGAGRFTSKQTDITDLTGFAHALELDCTTADTSIAAGEFLTIDYRFEGQDVQLFEKGFSSAKAYTFSFYAKADAAVTYGIEFRDHDNGRHCTSTFTTATSWTRHVINIPADTTGIFNNDNGESLRIRFWLHAGSTYNSGTAPTTWASQSNANSTSSSNGSFFASTDRSLFLTGVQLEVGEFDANSIAPFQHESFGDNLARCKRYYQQSYTHGTSAGTVTNDGAYMLYLGATGNTFRYNLNFETAMRATPTKVFYVPSTGTSGKAGYEGAGDVNAFTINNTFNTNKHALLYQTSVPITGHPYWHWTASAEL